MMAKTKVSLFVTGGLVVSSLAYAAVSRARDPVATIVPGPIARSIVARAALVPVDGISKIRARIDATVTRVHVREGEQIAAGQLLAELEAEPLRLRVERARAEVAALEATLQGVARGGHPEVRRELSALVVAASRELDVAKQNAARAKALHDSASITEAAAHEAENSEQIAAARLDATRARLEGVGRGGRFEISAARHRLEGGRAELMAMETELARTRLVAPAGGMVLARRVNPGDVVRALDANVLFELADPKRVELRGEVEELQAPLVRVGARVEVTAPGGLVQLGRGRVVRVSPGVASRLIAGDPSELRADSLVRAVYIAPESGTLVELPIGQRVEVRIALEPQAVAALVPRAAVTLENGAASVLVQNGLVREPRQVDLGMADAQHVQVHGVPLGTRVVLRED